MPAGPVDPHQLGLAVGRLGSAAKRHGKIALIVASALLQDGEVVEALVQGNFEGQPGVAVLTQGRVLLVNEAQWKVATATVEIEPTLTVQGWQEETGVAWFLASLPADWSHHVISDPVPGLAVVQRP